MGAGTATESAASNTQGPDLGPLYTCTGTKVRSGQYAALPQDADTRGGVAGIRTPVYYQKPGPPDRGVRTNRFEGSLDQLGPNVLESPLLGYKCVQGGFEGTSVGKEAAKEESDVLNKCCKVPPASPAPLVLRLFAVLSCGCYRRYSTARR